MARKTNVYALLKNVEHFIKAVPIDPRSSRYREWKENRVEVKKALKKASRMLKNLSTEQAISICGKPLPRQSL